MSPRSRLFVCAIAAALGAVTSVHGDQASPQQPTFVSGTQAVRVDVHATIDGQPLNDLRREELQILEDGALQTIQTFERITFARPGSAPTEAARTLSRSRELIADPRSRVFVVFLDTKHTGYLNPAVQTRFPIIKTLERMIGPDDLVGFMTPGMRPGDISFDRGLAALARLEGTYTYSPLHPDPEMLRDPKELLYASCYPPGPGSPLGEMTARHREKVTFDTLDDLIGNLGAMRQEPTYVIAITDGWRVFTENPQLGAMLEPRVPKVPLGGRGRDGVGVITERGTVTLNEAALRECDADLRTLASLDHRFRLREITDHANGSNVSFYPISARGLTTTGSTRTTAAMVPYENTTTFASEGVLRGLAEDTGGLAIVNTNNLESLLGQTMTRTSSFYLVSYSSTNNALDGKYRRITVKVNRPGVAVRARRGYVAARPAETRTAPSTDPVSKPDRLSVAFGALESQVRFAAGQSERANGGNAPSDFTLFRRGSSPALPFERTVDPRFRRNERLRLAVQSRATTAASARLLDRRGAPLAPLTQISQRPDAAGTPQWIEVELAMASLAIGDYAIEVTSGDEVRVIAFRVIP